MRVRVLSVGGYETAWLYLRLSTGETSAVGWSRVRTLDFSSFTTDRFSPGVRGCVIDYVTKHRTELLVKRRLARG